MSFERHTGGVLPAVSFFDLVAAFGAAIVLAGVPWCVGRPRRANPYSASCGTCLKGRRLKLPLWRYD